MGVSEFERIEVDIDELVLTGFGRINPDLVLRAFHRELTRLLHHRPAALASAENGQFDVLDNLPALPATTSARRLGESLARSVHHGLAHQLGRQP
jgi:hypothetical protein